LRHGIRRGCVGPTLDAAAGGETMAGVVAAGEGLDEAVKSLVEMGFDEARSREALARADPPTAENALAILVAGEDEPSQAAAEGGDGGAAKVVRSYRCVETGRLFRTMQDAQLYAERTGRSNFEESDVEVPPLSEEEKAEKVAQIREKLKQKREEREELEKIEDKQREINRRREGQNLVEVR